MKNWAAILGPRGIRVNAVAPGMVDTDRSNFTKTDAGRNTALGMQALKRIGKPEDIADVIAFLASRSALDHGSKRSGRWRVEALRTKSDAHTSLRILNKKRYRKWQE